LSHCLCGEHSIQHVFAFFGFLVRDEAEGGAILAEAVIEFPFFIPAVLVVVNVVVCLRIGEVQLWERKLEVEPAAKKAEECTDLHTSSGPMRITAPIQLSDMDPLLSFCREYAVLDDGYGAE
jgi:hypothetical protein